MTITNEEHSEWQMARMVNMVNDEWEDSTLGQCYDLITERIKSTSLPATTPYFGLEHLKPESPKLGKSGTVKDTTGQVMKFQPSDTLFGRLRPYLRKVNYAHSGGYCSPEILVLRPRTGKVEPRYLQLLASSEPVIAHAIANSAGSRMPRTSAKDLATAPISLPPLLVQRRIVDIAEAVDRNVDGLLAEYNAATKVRSALLSNLLSHTVKIPASYDNLLENELLENELWED